MLKIALTRLQQGHRTSGYPTKPVVMPAPFRGWPNISPAKCRAGCQDCTLVCPTGAVSANPLSIDLGLCLFCGRCQDACLERAIAFSRDHRLATSTREALIVKGGEPRLAAPLPPKLRGIFHHSFKMRQVSAGGCNACEADLSVLQINVFDLGRFGLQWVASPRHADAVVVTGPVTANMAFALDETYKAVPTPKLVIAAGACAISGGPFAGAPLSRGIPDKMPIDLFIPGCPPHPYTILDGILRLLGRLPQ